MENALRANPNMFGSSAAGTKKIAVPAGRGREVIETIRHGLKDGGYTVSITQLCCWFEVARDGVLPAHPQGASSPGSPLPAEQIVDRGQSSLGYRTVTRLLDFDRNTVQRSLQMTRVLVKND
jgi:putative transposase